jgi:hypothetical protein
MSSNNIFSSWSQYECRKYLNFKVWIEIYSSLQYLTKSVRANDVGGICSTSESTTETPVDVRWIKQKTKKRRFVFHLLSKRNILPVNDFKMQE